MLAAVDPGWVLLGRLTLHLLQGCHHFLVHHIDRLEGPYHHLELDDASIAHGNHVDAIDVDTINLASNSNTPCSPSTTCRVYRKRN